jgi:hypothetical protein
MYASAVSIGFTVIVVLYVSVGALAAAGSIVVAQRIFNAKGEQIFFAGFLICVAAFYLAFAAYFGRADVWPLESTAVLAFGGLALLGIRFPLALVLGYPLHAVWDLLHELQAHTNGDWFAGRPATAIPLAYGAFCATYDLCMAVYFHLRRPVWLAAWKAG